MVFCSIWERLSISLLRGDVKKKNNDDYECQRDDGYTSWRVVSKPKMDGVKHTVHIEKGRVGGFVLEKNTSLQVCIRLSSGFFLSLLLLGRKRARHSSI